MMYGLKTVALSNGRMTVVEGAPMTRMDRIRNKQITGSFKVEQFGDGVRDGLNTC